MKPSLRLAAVPVAALGLYLTWHADVVPLESPHPRGLRQPAYSASSQHEPGSPPPRRFVPDSRSGGEPIRAGGQRRRPPASLFRTLARSAHIFASRQPNAAVSPFRRHTPDRNGSTQNIPQPEASAKEYREAAPKPALRGYIVLGGTELLVSKDRSTKRIIVEPSDVACKEDTRWSCAAR